MIYANVIFALLVGITELQQERVDIQKKHASLKRNHVTLIKNKKEKESKLAEMQRKVTDVYEYLFIFSQLLKFGREVDLEKLEKLGINKTVDELRERLLKDELKRAREIEEYEVYSIVNE